MKHNWDKEKRTRFLGTRKAIFDECIVWQGCINEGGYGVIVIEKPDKRRVFMAHRVSYEIHKGTIPLGLCVCHRCDVRNCVNPEHLFLGTKADNNHDMKKKGRYHILHGEDHPNSKITEEDVRLIRRSFDSQRVLSSRFGISKTEIGRIKRGEYWKTVEEKE